MTSSTMKIWINQLGLHITCVDSRELSDKHSATTSTAAVDEHAVRRKQTCTCCRLAIFTAHIWGHFTAQRTWHFDPAVNTALCSYSKWIAGLTKLFCIAKTLHEYTKTIFACKMESAILLRWKDKHTTSDALLSFHKSFTDKQILNTTRQ